MTGLRQQPQRPAGEKEVVNRLHSWTDRTAWPFQQSHLLKIQRMAGNRAAIGILKAANSGLQAISPVVQRLTFAERSKIPATRRAELTVIFGANTETVLQTASDIPTLNGWADQMTMLNKALDAAEYAQGSPSLGANETELASLAEAVQRARAERDETLAGWLKQIAPGSLKSGSLPVWGPKTSTADVPSKPIGVQPQTKRSFQFEIIGQKGKSGARKHYNDGWGDLYEITDDNALIGELRRQAGPEQKTPGQHEIYLGGYTLKKNEPMGCNILYLVTQIGPQHFNVRIFHCGPGKGAG